MTALAKSRESRARGQVANPANIVGCTAHSKSPKSCRQSFLLRSYKATLFGLVTWSRQKCANDKRKDHRCFKKRSANRNTNRGRKEGSFAVNWQRRQIGAVPARRHACVVQILLVAAEHGSRRNKTAHRWPCRLRRHFLLLDQG